VPDPCAWCGLDVDVLETKLRSLPSATATVLDKALAGQDLDADDLTHLFGLNDLEVCALFATANLLKTRVHDRAATYVVNRNINFTNVCYNACRFCAYNRPRSSPEAFLMSAPEIARLALEARDLGATEVCVQAGLSPDLDSSFYPRLLHAIRDAAPDIHIHACSPQEEVYWSEKAGQSIRDYLIELKASGLDSLPGTSAEILVDPIRSAISPKRITTAKWLEVIQTAHSLGLPTTATIMYGHIESHRERALHLIQIRDQQRRSHGFTEFVPLSFIASSRQARRRNPLIRSVQTLDVLKMHAIARLALWKDIPNIQTSWVKEGLEIATLCLRVGANDLGGTLINESIAASAGANNGQMMRPCDLRTAIRTSGSTPAQRDTLYRILRSFEDPASDPIDPLDRLDSPLTPGNKQPRRL